MRCGASSFVPFLIPHSPLPSYPVTRLPGWLADEALTNDFAAAASD